jgi:hypothetical protein
MSTKKRKANEAGIHVVGYVEEELTRIADRSTGFCTHTERVFAEALLILLKRTATKEKRA